MEYAFTLDRLVKGKADPEETDKFDAKTKERMLAEVDAIKASMKHLYDISQIMSR